MDLKNFENSKKSTIIVCLLAIYFIGVGIYFFLVNYTKNLFFIPDERLYIQAAKAFSVGYGIHYNGLKSGFQKILYPIIISPAFFVDDLQTQIRLISLLGIMFEMTSVFPIYLISRKLNLSRIKSLLLCFFCLSFPVYLFSMTFMSETAFLPVWLWVIYLIIFLLDSKEANYLIPIVLGVLGYFLFMCKEVGIIALPTLLLTKLIYVIKKKSSIKEMIPSVISCLAFLCLHLIFRFFIFGDSAGTYSYAISMPDIQKNSKMNPVSFFLYSYLFYLGYMILVNNIFPVFIRAEGDDLNRKLSMYIEMAILILIGVVVYKIILKEDYGLLSPRLHFRYFEPLFIPYTIAFVARFDDIKEETAFDHKYSKLVFWIYLMVLMVLPGLNSGGILDSTTLTAFFIPEKIAYLFFLGSLRKTLIMTIIMKVIILLITLIEVRLIKKDKKRFMIMFMVVAIIVNFIGIGIKYIEIRKMYEVSDEYVEEMQIINDEMKNLSGRKLMISRQDTRLSEILITYYDINNTDVYLAEAEYDTLDKTVTLKVTGASREANIDDYSYIVYENGVWEDSDRESIPPDKIILTTEHFFIVEN